MLHVRRQVVVLLVTITLLSSAACQPTLISQIERAEENWNRQGIMSYRIEVMVMESTWHLQTHKITVRDGQVTDASAWCSPAPAEGRECEVRQFDPEDYTVPGLFVMARSSAESQRGRWTKIEFDPTYGYPRSILADDPEIMDDDLLVGVSAFEVLE
jgi:hypothetical protein